MNDEPIKHNDNDEGHDVVRKIQLTRIALLAVAAAILLGAFLLSRA